MSQCELSSAISSKRPRIAHKVADLAPSGIRAFFDLVIGRDDVISLGVGEPDFVTPWRIREAATWRVARGETSYTSNAGILSLRVAIAKYLKNRFGVLADPVDQILVTVGVSEALDIAMRTLLEPGDEVIIWEPCYVAYSALISLAGGVPVRLVATGEDGFALNIESLRALITPKTKAILLGYPNNPTGATLERDVLEQIVALADEYDLIIVSDEVYGELTHDMEHVSIASLPGAQDNVLLLSGFSKAFAMTGWRLGYAVGPKDIIAGMTKIHQYCIMCAPVMAQRAAETALIEGLDDMYEMCDIYRQRRNLIVKGLNEVGLSCHSPAGAFYAFPSISASGMNSMEFCVKLLEEEQIAVVPGTAFGDSGEGYTRICYAVSFDVIHRALEGMDRFMRRLNG